MIDPEVLNIYVVLDNAYENEELTIEEYDALLHELNDVGQNIRRIISQLRLRLRRRT